MHVNEYVSQLSSSLQLSWTEAGAQLQGRLMVKKKSRVKIEPREQENTYFLKTGKGESALGVGDVNFKEKAMCTRKLTHKD